MSSRVDVSVTLRTKDFLKACCHGMSFDGCDSFSLLDSDDSEGFVEMSFSDVSNADTGVEHVLKSLSIPFDRSWGGDGCDIEAGESFFRIERSGPVEKSFDTATAWKISFHELESAYQQGTVGDLIERTRDAFEVMSWEDQSAYLREVDEKEEQAYSQALIMLKGMGASDALRALDAAGVAHLARKILKVPVEPVEEGGWYAGPDHKVVDCEALSKIIEQGFNRLSLVARIRHLHGIISERRTHDEA